jgi:hypothetical protein
MNDLSPRVSWSHLWFLKITASSFPLRPRTSRFCIGSETLRYEMQPGPWTSGTQDLRSWCAVPAAARRNIREKQRLKT